MYRPGGIEPPSLVKESTSLISALILRATISDGLIGIFLAGYDSYSFA